jgi:hypothetical protein
MVLGGDPESAYVLGAAAAGHAVALTWWPGREERPRPRGRRLLVVSLIAIVLAVVWVGGTLELARRLPGLRAPGPIGLPPAAFPWMRWVPTLVVAGWGSGLALVGKLPPCGGRGARASRPSRHGHDPARRPLRDGDGSIYWVLATALPGFRWFRFPSKLLCTTALGTAGLAGLGWDRLTVGLGRRRTAAIATILLGVGLAALLSVTWARTSIVAALRSSPAATSVTLFGPLDAEGAIVELRRGLAHGSIVLVSVLMLVWLVHNGRFPALAAALTLILMTVDLALANARLVLTVPQSLLDATPEVVRIIADAARQAARGAAHPPGPFRVHRMPMWYPALWSRAASIDRIRDFDRWEHDTIRPKYGLLPRIEYTVSSGVAEIDAYAEFFGGFRKSADAETAGRLGLLPGQPLIVFPRRSFDMWNTRYFVLPANSNGWNDETRAYAAFVSDAERIYPPPDAFEGPDGPERRRRWVAGSDFQVFRNRAAYPRAWVVHDAQSLPALSSSGRAGRDAAIRAILFDVSDPDRTAWLDAAKRVELTAYPPGTPPLPSEIPAITVYDAHQVALDVALERPGLVILADIFSPDWHLTIDGSPAPILRANLMMRGAAVAAGRHRLVFGYEPRAFRVGMALSGVGLAVLVVLGGTLWVRPPAPRRSQLPRAEPDNPGGRHLTCRSSDIID